MSESDTAISWIHLRGNIKTIRAHYPSALDALTKQAIRTINMQKALGFGGSVKWNLTIHKHEIQTPHFRDSCACIHRYTTSKLQIR